MRETATATVVGAGPVGQTTGLLLAQHGIDVALIDAADHRDPTGSKSICQQRHVLDIWTHLGAEAITTEGLTWTTARTYYQDRPIHHWSFTPTAATPPFVNISQARTEAILDTLIAAQPRITQQWNRPVTAIYTDHHGATLTLADDTTIDTPYAILCTGAHNTELARQLDIDLTGTSHPDRFLICDITADLPHHDHERHFHFDPAANPGRQILIHPCPDNTYRIDWQVPAEFDLDTETRTGRLDHRIRQVIGNVDYRLDWATVYRFHSRLATPMATGRTFLAGDAAHLMAPFGARGLNSGIADAENLAWKIAGHAHGWAQDPILASYHTERHAAAIENLTIVDTTMKFLAPQTSRQHAHRNNTLTRAAHNPDHAHHVDSGRFAEPFWYDTSPLTTSDPHRPCRGRPPKGHNATPAPGTICPDATLPDGTALHRQLRDGFTLISDTPADWFDTTTDAPTRTIDTTPADPTGALATALGIWPGECWLVRPDAHLAATIPATAERPVRAALQRVLGHEAA